MPGLPMEPPGQRPKGFRIFYVMPSEEGLMEYNQLVYAYSKEQAEVDFWKWYREHFGRSPASISRVEVEA